MIRQIKKWIKLIKTASSSKQNEIFCEKCIDGLKKEAEKDKEYSAMVKSFLLAEKIPYGF